MRYRLRTLLIVLALGPPVLAAIVPPVVAWLQPAPLILESDSLDRRFPHHATGCGMAVLDDGQPPSP